MEIFKKMRFLSGNAIKIIAAIAMFIDHFGLMFYPNNMALRAIGRLAMPLFAFMIAESARYTKNKTKHFLLMFGLGAVCQLVYVIAMGSNSMPLYNILITFSISTLILYALDAFKRSLSGEFNQKALKTLPPLLASFILLLTVLGAYFLCNCITVDYGFWGVMLPVFANLLDFRAVKKYLGENTPKWMKIVDSLLLRVLCFGVGCIFLYLSSRTNYPDFPYAYLFLTLPLLLLYNGERGKLKIKYFFYIFYPAHLVLLEGLWMILKDVL